MASSGSHSRPQMHLDDVPAGAAERRLELLDDLAVAAHRAVEPLQVAVDDEDQVVELLARRQRDGAERFGLVGLAVAEERPDLGVRLRLQPAILEVAHEARLVDRHDRAEAHRHRRVFPEVGHQPRMRIRRQAAARLQLAAEVLELRLVDAPFEIRARVDAGRGVALEEDDVAVVAVAVPAEEVVEADFVERRRRRERRDVAADALFRLVGAHDHRRGVPADEALDAALDLGAAGHQRLFVGGNGVDVGSVGGERQLDAVLAGVNRQLAEQPRDLCRAAALQHIIKRVEPFAGFDGVELRGVFRSDVSHGNGILSARRECRLDRLAAVGQPPIVPWLCEGREPMRRQLLRPDLRRRCRSRWRSSRSRSDRPPSAAAPPPPRVRPGVRRARSQRSIACTDFYQFACGGWIAKNPMPADRRSCGRFDELQERNFTILRRILEDAGRRRTGDRKKAADYYAACMDEPAIESERARRRSRRDLATIDALVNPDDLPVLVAHLHTIGVPALLPVRRADRPRRRDAVDCRRRSGRPRPAGSRLLPQDRRALGRAARQVRRARRAACSRWPAQPRRTGRRRREGGACRSRTALARPRSIA